MSKLFFKTSGASIPSSHIGTESTDHNYPLKTFTKLIAGTAMILPSLGKRNEDFRTENGTFQGLSIIDYSSAIADHVKTTTGHNIKWENFNISASGRTDYHCKVKEALFIHELQPALNVNVSSEKVFY